MLGIAGRVNADIAASMLDVLHESIFLCLVKHITRCEQKDHRPVLCETLYSKDAAIFSEVHRHMMFVRKPVQCCYAIGNRCMAEGGRFRKNEQFDGPSLFSARDT